MGPTATEFKSPLTIFNGGIGRLEGSISLGSLFIAHRSLTRDDYVQEDPIGILNANDETARLSKDGESMVDCGQ